MEVIVTDEFREWYESLSESEQEAIFRVVSLLEQEGVQLGHPYSSAIKTAKTVALRELRVQHSGDAIRLLYAFDPRRDAILLIGGTKRNEGWYAAMVPRAEQIYHEYIHETGQDKKVLKMKQKGK